MRAPGRLVLAVARRMCSTRVLETLVAPSVADLQHEHRECRGRERWAGIRVLVRGYMGLTAALALDMASFPARHVRENWIAPDAPGRRLTGQLVWRAAAVLVVVTTLLMADDYTRWQRMAEGALLWESAVYLLPSVLSVAVPVSLLLGLVAAVRRLADTDASTRGWIAPATAVSLAVAAGVFVLVAWIVPVANNEVRATVIEALGLEGRQLHSAAPGPRELTLGELSTSIAKAGQGPAPPVLTLEWHKKLVQPLFCALLGPLAMGLAMPREGRSVSPFRSSVFAALMIVAFFAGLWLGERAVRQGRLGPVAGAWAASVIPSVAAAIALARREDRRDDPAGAPGEATA